MADAARWGRLRVLAAFTTPVEAQIASGALAREGIEATLQDAALVSVAWHLSNAVGGVKLLVSEEDLARAEAVLQRARLGLRLVHGAADDSEAQSEPGSAVDWAAPGLQAVEGTGSVSPAWVARRLDARRPESATTVASDLDNATTDVRDLDGATTGASDLALRAFRAAVFGLVLFPPLFHLWSSWLLLRWVAGGGLARREGRRRALVAFLIDAAVLGAVTNAVLLRLR